jgi:hypothetical protein
MDDQGQRLMPPSWEQHRQEADSEGSLYRRCFTAAGLPQRQGRAREIWGIDGTWLASVDMDESQGDGEGWLPSN